MKKYTNFGFSSILLSFVMICVATFSALSLLTANSDYRLSKRVAQRSEAYCHAQETAYGQLAAIDQALLSAYESSSDPAEYYANAESLISNQLNGTWSADSSMPLFTYQIPLENSQHLEIILKIQYPDGPRDGFYRIIQWKTVILKQKGNS